MRPIVVRVRLASPVIGDAVHLDALLTQAAVRRHGCDTVADRSTPADDLPSVSIPLAHVHALGASCYLATASRGVGGASPAIVHQVRRRDSDDWDRLVQPVQVSAGPHKDCLVRNPAQTVSELEWHAFGRRADVMDLLRLLWGHPDRPHGAIGSKRRTGSGEIVAWSCEASEHDAERCLRLDGRAARHLPPAWVLSAERWHRGAWRGPYWHRDRQDIVPPVGVKVELKPELHRELLSCR